MVYGFGGIRLRNDGLLFAPRSDPNLPQLIIPHLKFQGMDLRYEVDEKGERFQLTNLTETKDFTIYCRNNRIYLPDIASDIPLDAVEGKTEKKYQVQLPRSTRYIQNTRKLTPFIN